MREWQMEKLEDREERPESVDVPMLVFFGDASGEIEVVYQCGCDRQD